jgi:hypothetical protein
MQSLPENIEPSLARGGPIVSFQMPGPFKGGDELVLFDKWMLPKWLYGCHSVIGSTFPPSL